MRERMIVVLGAAALWVGLGGAAARAQDTETLLYVPPDEGLFESLSVTIGMGVMDRGTTGIGDPLLGYGYDHAGGAAADLGLRLYFASSNQYFNHGILVRGTYMAGQSFGLGRGYGFATTIVDVAYAFRFHCPCISNEERKWYVTGFAGLTGMHANASTGDAPADDANQNARIAASGKLDHVALGGVLGVTMDLHVGMFIVGATVDLREHFTLGDSPVARSFETSASVHVGADLPL